jgi:hypothetical protein
VTDDCGRELGVQCEVGGTINNPWKSMAKAAVCMKPGDVFYLRGGTYGAAFTTYPDQAQYALFTGKSGTKENPITFKSYPNESVRITAPIRLNPPWFKGTRGDYITIEGFEIIGGFITTAAKGTVVRNNHIYGVNGDCGGNPAGVYVDNGASDILIEGNKIHDNYDRSKGDYTKSFKNCSNIVLMHHISNVIIRNNELYNSASGIHLKYEEGLNTLIEGNTIHDTVTGIFGTNNNYTVRNNVFYNCGGQNVIITNNTIIEGVIGVVSGSGSITNNVITGTAGAAMGFNAGEDGDRNGFPNFNLSAINTDQNCFYTLNGNVYQYGYSRSYDLAKTRANFDKELNSIFAQPFFRNAGARDYRQASGSPCTGKGATISVP